MILAPDPVTFAFVGTCSTGLVVAARICAFIPALKRHKSLMTVWATAIGGAVGLYFWIAALLGGLHQPGKLLPGNPGLLTLALGTSGFAAVIAAPVLLWVRHVRGVVFDPGPWIEVIACIVFAVTIVSGAYLGLN